MKELKFSLKTVDTIPSGRASARDMEFDYSDIPPGPSYEEAVFGLGDIPDDWWIRLNDHFVDQLDRINRPWKHADPPQTGIGKMATYWEAGEPQPETRARYSPERLAGYKRRHSFFEKLWGRHRWKDYHFAEDDPRRYVNTGPWILKREIAVIREGIDIEDSELEKVITGMRLGKFSDNVRELRFRRLPIRIDESWAWFLGYYMGYGTIYSYHREGRHTREGGHHSIYVKVRAEEEVLPKLLNVTSKMGSKAVLYTLKSPHPKSKFRSLGAVRKTILFGWPEFVVLKKFGMPVEFLQEGKPRGLPARNYKPRIPRCIKEKPELMKAFLEGYLNTTRLQSVLGPALDSSCERLTPRLELRVQCSGSPENYVRAFMDDIDKWFGERGVKGSLWRYKVETKTGTVTWGLIFNSIETTKFFFDEFEITRTAARARFIARYEAFEDPVLFEALRSLRSPENVILGMLLEQPLTREELSSVLHMREHALTSGLKSLQRQGLIERRGDHYYYAPTEFAERRARQYEGAAEQKLDKMDLYARRLLFQCALCRRVYIRERKVCGYCGGKIRAAQRRHIIRRLDRVRMYNLYLARIIRSEL